jgi:hypothetical protein
MAPFKFTDDFFFDSTLHYGSVYIVSSSATEEVLANETIGLSLDFTDNYFESTGHYGSAYLKGNF